MHPTDMQCKDARQIAQRLSLRPPLVASLDLLTRIVDLCKPSKDADLPAALGQVQAVLGERHGLQPHVPKATDFTGFEREFLNLCFALATGAGKTRLLGAFIAWLYKKHGYRHFLVVAPNLTIYQKLKADLGKPESAKYVLQGIPEFATDRPLVITGDDYQDGRGVREEARRQMNLDGIVPAQGKVHINVFNIAKIAEAEGRGKDSKLKIKKLQEYIGQSYFDYLASLPDLVILMDEAHNYRAKAGWTVLNELKPVLGLELTATPFRTTGGNQRDWFQNVAYDYPLGAAMDDGYVKEPEVAYRRNVDLKQVENVERMKLDDAVAIHAETKTHLLTYALGKGVRPVKPFVLIAAKDTAHADALTVLLESTEFHGGRFRGKVVKVHTNMPGAEKKAADARVAAIESPESEDEILIHVESLEEGWDVTNLYTLVPLRKADAPSLVLQSMGRGLRLPYGKRTGDERVDKLTIVSHDRFQDLLDEAKSVNSELSGKLRMRDLDVAPPEKAETVVAQPTAWTAGREAARQAAAATVPASAGADVRSAMDKHVDRVTEATRRVIEHVAGVRSLSDLCKPEVRAKVAAMVDQELAAQAQPQGELALAMTLPPTEDLLKPMLARFVERAIEVPKIVVVPSADHRLVYRDFTLDVRDVHWQPLAREIVLQELRGDQTRRVLVSEHGLFTESRPENYIVRKLVEKNDLHADVYERLQDLAGQFVAHLRSYLPSEEAVHLVLLSHEKEAAQRVYEQLVAHRGEFASAWHTTVYPAFETLRPAGLKSAAGLPRLDVNQPLQNKGDVRKYVFTGFRRGATDHCKFDSDAERRFAVLLDQDEQVHLWLKPPGDVLNLRWRLNGVEANYRPDFVVETLDRKWLCEVKADDEMTTPEVQEKARAGHAWCAAATEHAREQGGKPWGYLLLADSKIQSNFTLAGLAASV
jgi:type III restriction enzyme